MGRKLDQAVLLMRRGQLKWKGWEEGGEEAGAAVMRLTHPNTPPLLLSHHAVETRLASFYAVVLQILVH